MFDSSAEVSTPDASVCIEDMNMAYSRVLRKTYKACRGILALAYGAAKRSDRKRCNVWLDGPTWIRNGRADF